MSDIKSQYKETLDYLFQQLPMYQREGAVAMKKDLTNIKALCDVLDTPQEKFNSIHIAGTNGKGSTAHLLACLLQNRGIKTGLYTSPHYADFRERIKLDGEYISKKAVVEFVEKYKHEFEKIKPSFFEITVAMAFDYFAKADVNVAIIETGLGGRLDSTNILRPDISVITNISYDHQQFLGDTLPKIAAEKAGIIKKDTDVIIGETQEEVKNVFIDKAAELNSSIHFADQRFRAELKKTTAACSVYNIYRDDTLVYPNVKIELFGNFQHKNIATCFQTIEILNNIGVTKMIREYDIRNGLCKLKEMTKFKGRFDIIGQKPTILCDSAHNESGITNMMKELRDLEYNALHMVIGMVNDKDIKKILKLLPTEATYYFCKANIPRGLDANTLAQKAKTLNLNGTVFESVEAALTAAKKGAKSKDLIYVGGSTFVVAEVV